MALDGVGQSPIIKTGTFEKKEIEHIKVEEPAPISDSESSESFQNPHQKSRLGKILSLIEEKSKRKSKQDGKRNKKNPYEAYVDVARLIVKQKSGGELDLKV